MARLMGGRNISAVSRAASASAAEVVVALEFEAIGLPLSHVSPKKKNLVSIRGKSKRSGKVLPGRVRDRGSSLRERK